MKDFRWKKGKTYSELIEGYCNTIKLELRMARITNGSELVEKLNESKEFRAILVNYLVLIGNQTRAFNKNFKSQHPEISWSRLHDVQALTYFEKDELKVNQQLADLVFGQVLPLDKILKSKPTNIE